MRTWLLAVLLFASFGVSAADYQAEVDQFFRLYAAGKQAEALESIYAASPWIDTSSDAVQNLRNQLLGAQRLVGAYHGNVEIGKTEVAGRFVHLTYLALHDRQPLRMEFQFYRPEAEWRIHSFSFDDAFDDDVEKATRESIAKGKP